MKLNLTSSPIPRLGTSWSRFFLTLLVDSVRLNRETFEVKITPVVWRGLVGPVILDLALNRAIQLREHVGAQIAASGFSQVRFCYASCLGFPSAVVGKMLHHIAVLVHRRVDVLHDP
jgi:hypothetical protein